MKLSAKGRYVKGRKKEYKIINNLKNQNFAISGRLNTHWNILQRTAGSHSPVDIIAIDSNNKKILLIQAKPDNFSIRNTEKLLADNEALNGTYEVEFVVM